MQANNIDEVLSILADIVADTTRRKDPLGYFAALYRQVTVRVKDGIVAGIFENGQRMDRFDASFANRYFKAYDQYRNGEQPSRSWKFAFDQARSGRLIILQNLLLGINAHINLDLGVVAGTTFPGAALEDFHDDFNTINEVLASLVSEVRATIELFSPLLADLAAYGGGDLAQALEFSVDVARDDAWRSATVMAYTPAAIQPLTIASLDSKAKLLGRIVADPPEPVGTVVQRIRDEESTDVAAIITALDTVIHT
jgi:Family of unknown function (DUF5995)